MPIDKKALADYIARQSAWQGGRIKDLRKDDDSDTHDKVSCAITASVLQELAYLAESKPLRKHDVLAYLDGFMKSAGMTWETTPMGAEVIVRIADQEKAHG